MKGPASVMRGFPKGTGSFKGEGKPTSGGREIEEENKESMRQRNKGGGAGKARVSLGGEK